MNGISHSNIMLSAYKRLPENMRNTINQPEELIKIAGNYPDLFDCPTNPEEDKNKIDPNWRKYCIYPETFPAKGLHLLPWPITEEFYHIPVYQYYFTRMIESLREKNYADFIKFSGCLSHAMGDSTQPAHLSPDPNNVMMSQLLPVPDKPYLKGFHYHSTVEAVVGECAPLEPPVSFGLTADEAGWKLACEARKAVKYCRRFLIPTIEALFENDMAKAESLAVAPVTFAAQLTANAMFTAYNIAFGIPMDLPPEDLRLLPPKEEFHDLVYGGKAILDANLDVPPYTAPAVPGKLRIGGAVVTIPGLGVLPHSGMNGDRMCFMKWLLPEKVFKTFRSKVGLHAEIGTGAVEFLVFLDDKQVWSSGRMTNEMDALDCDIAVGNAQTLTLKVVDANNGTSFWKNHAYWGEPKLYR